MVLAKLCDLTALKTCLSSRMAMCSLLISTRTAFDCLSRRQGVCRRLLAADGAIATPLLSWLSSNIPRASLATSTVPSSLQTVTIIAFVRFELLLQTLTASFLHCAIVESCLRLRCHCCV